ncbi:hypothetical protein SAVIM40S_05860 [Streptomyces avidinii]
MRPTVPDDPALIRFAISAGSRTATATGAGPKQRGRPFGSDLDGHFVQGHGLKLTGQAARGKYTLRKWGARQKWSAGQTRKTFYETTDASGGTGYWVDGDDIVLRSG